MTTKLSDLKKADSRVQLDRTTLLDFYRTMYTSRRIDDKEIQLKRQNVVYFQISGAGHEAIQIAAGAVLRPGYDWIYPYYRDRALALQIGIPPIDHLLASVAAKTDPNSGARQMPNHWSDPRLHMVSRSSCTGMQFLQAVGAAEAGHRYALIEEIQDRATLFAEDEIVLVSSGDGTTSEGEFWESLNTACNLKLPVLYLVQDNGYAISTPVEVQTAGGSISRLVTGFPDLYIEECDGTDIFASVESMTRAVQYCRERRGPALVHAHVVRPYSHSLSDDEQNYRIEEEREDDARRDPIKKLNQYLISNRIASRAQLERIEAEVDQEINSAADQALAVGQPSKTTAQLYIYSPDVDPTSAQFDTESQVKFHGNQGTMVDLINRCLHEEMKRDPRILIFGEDVADLSRSEYLNEIKGKGGVFKVTQDLQRKFGDDRVFNSPLAEANIVGRAMGMATRGFKPVVEIQFFDYIWPAYMQMHNEIPLLRWRSNNAWKCPMVVRVPFGGYLKGGAIYHSMTGAQLFTSIPGWRVIAPSTALDAAGLLRTAIRCDDPVLFLEHKHLYRQTYNKSQYPDPNFLIPFGKAKTVYEGTDITIITYGALVQRSLVAAKEAASQGISVEVIDLRSLNPYDWEAIATSIKKTSKVIVAYEDSQSWGYGAEIAARIADELFEYLDAPVKRVAALDCFVAYAPDVEDEILPQSDDVLQAITALAKY